jgi:hypothetical protein
MSENGQTLGCYSVVRYSDSLSDQRVNLGILLWHPQEGYRQCFLKNLDGVSAISPKVELQDLKYQLHVIEERISANHKDGPAKFAELSEWFRDGLEVTSPYPARFQDLQSALHRLRVALLPQMPVSQDLALVSPQYLALRDETLTGHRFEMGVFRAIERAAHLRNASAEPMQVRRIGKLPINPGLRTVAGRRKALWRALPFRRNQKAKSQVSEAKNVAMDFLVLSDDPEFRNHQRFAVVQVKRPLESSADESIAWLKKTTDRVFSIDRPEAAARLLDQALRMTA